MFYWEIIAARTEVSIKHINIVKVLNVKAGGAKSGQETL